MLPPYANADRVLLVDEPTQTEMYALQLERAGYSVMSARDSDAAIRAAQDFQPAAIVIEPRLLGVDGLAILQRFKQDPATAAIPVIVLTAAVFQLTEDDVKAAGAAALLWKPCYPADLVAALRQLQNAPGPDTLA